MRWLAPKSGGYSAVPRPGVDYSRRIVPPGRGSVATPSRVIAPWPDDELWAWYDSDPKAHALVQLALRTAEQRKVNP